MKNNVGVKGSFVIAAICQDGIIVATESRANIYDKSKAEQIPLAFFDTIQKVFPIDRFAIAETGQGVIGNVFFSTVIRDFSSSVIISKPQNLLSIFLDYSKQTMPAEIFAELQNQILFSAGYDDGEPYIGYFNKNQQPAIGLVNGSGLIESDKTIVTETDFSEILCEIAADMLIEAIDKYAEIDDRWKTIGGPISVLKITEESTDWIRNEPEFQRWDFVPQMIEEYKRDNSIIQLISEEYQDKIDDLFGK